jgi:hypothetical protein
MDNWKNENNLFFEREDYCQGCRKILNQKIFGKNEYVVDCRTEAEAMREEHERINVNYP